MCKSSVTSADVLPASVLQPTSASSWLLWVWPRVPIACGATGPTRPSCLWGYFWLLPTPWLSRWGWMVVSALGGSMGGGTDKLPMEWTFLYSHSSLSAQAPSTPCLSQVLSPCHFPCCKMSPGDFVVQDMQTNQGGKETPPSRVHALNVPWNPQPSSGSDDGQVLCWALHMHIAFDPHRHPMCYVLWCPHFTDEEIKA